jgi:uncharacterized C2H2 Zn-finger protein
MRELDLARTVAPEISVPAATAVVASESQKLFICKQCDRRFKKAMIAARHFNSAHMELKAEKDSWRLHVEEVWE